MDSSDLLIFKLRKGKEEPEEKKEEKPKPVAQAPKPASKPAPKSAPKAAPKPVPKQEPKEEPKPQPEPQVTRMAPKNEDVKSLNCISHPWRPAYAICSVCNLPFCYADIMVHNGRYYCLADIDKATMEKETRVQRNSFNYIAAAIFAANSAVLFLFFNQQALYIINLVLQYGISALLNNYNYSYLISMADTIVLTGNVLAIFASLSRSNKAFVFSSVVIGLSMMLLVFEYLTSGTQNLLVSAVILLFAMLAVALSRMSSIGNVADRLSVANVDWPHPGTYQ